jgi:hypothetical protein
VKPVRLFSSAINTLLTASRFRFDLVQSPRGRSNLKMREPYRFSYH